MKFVKHFIIYTGLMVVFGGLIFYLLHAGNSLDPSRVRLLNRVPGGSSKEGAFLAGIAIPKNEVMQKRIIERISDVSMVMLLPLFFVYTGLRTQAGILNSGLLWISFCLILVCAVAGKFGGSTLVARALGQSWKNSLSIGALMNTRGLMELVVLNIGYDLGILSTEIFSMMVLMALLTTMMTSPALDWIEKRKIKSSSPGPV